MNRRQDMEAPPVRYPVVYEIEQLHARAFDPCANTSISGTGVAREFDRIIVMRGRLGAITSDNDTELTSNAILQWTDERCVACNTSGQASRSRTRASHSPPGDNYNLHRPHSKVGWLM